MKILVVCQHYWPENFRITEVCESFVEMGHEVEALVGLPNYPTGDIPKEYRLWRNRKQMRNGVYIHRCFEIGRKPSKIGLAINYVSYMLSATCKAVFRRHKYDAIYAYSTSPVLMSLPAAVARRFFGKKLVIHILDIWPACLSAMNIEKEHVIYRFMTPVSRWIYKQADVLLYGSKKFQNYLEDTHNIHVPDEDYLPQFADTVFETKAEDYQKQKSGMFNFVFAGNIGKMQAVDVIIKTAEITKNAPITWHIIGDGSELEKCQELTKKLKLDEKVIFYGRKPLEEMPVFYAMADAMLLTMRSDELVNNTLPGKIQGYMAQSKPILCSAAGESEIVITQAKNGFCAKAESPEAFAEIAMKFIALSNEEIIQMGVKSREYYDAHFPKALHMKKLIDAMS